MPAPRPALPPAPNLALGLVLLALHAAATPTPPTVPDLFPPGSVPVVRLDLPPSGRASLRSAPRSDVPGTFGLGDRSLDAVGVHLKGSVGSFRPVDDSPGFTLTFGRFLPDQRFQGLGKIHLNNSLEDPTRLHPAAGNLVFASLGFPLPRLGHARLRFDGRDLGVYVVAEGFTDDWLRSRLGHAEGTLFEPGRGADLDGPMTRRAGLRPGDPQRPFSGLLQAAQEPDLAERHRGIAALLDLSRFLDFMAAEVLLGHRDGYTMARNNYRLLADARTGRLTFVPHGMDQLFEYPELPWKPQCAGLLARAVLEIPEAAASYRGRLSALNDAWLANGRLADFYHERGEALARTLPFREAGLLREEVRQTIERIKARSTSLRRQLSTPSRQVARFESGSLALASAKWTTTPHAPADSATIRGRKSPDGVPSLPLVAHSDRTQGAWRATLSVPRGRYRFEGRARVEAIDPLPFGKHHGAGLRVAGRSRTESDPMGPLPWQSLGTDFTVLENAETLELMCELRARGGTVWFDLASLRLVRLD